MTITKIILGIFMNVTLRSLLVIQKKIFFKINRNLTAQILTLQTLVQTFQNIK